TAHTLTNGLTTTAQYRNFRVASTVVNPPLITPGSATFSGGVFHATFSTQAGVNYSIEYIDRFNPPRNFQPLTTITGNGSIMSFSDSGPFLPYTPQYGQTRFYRIHVVP